MRSSKSRSRGNKNRNRSSGNNQNRVFDSSGPEGKVRGTPQQIIDKYTQLFRDATLSNDRVAAENFQQHAEHYSRVLNEAQREVEARREQHEAQQRERNAQREAERGERQERQQNETVSVADPSSEPQPNLQERAPISAPDNGLVETPESKPIPRKRTRRPRKPKEDTSAPEKTEIGETAPEIVAEN